MLVPGQHLLLGRCPRPGRARRSGERRTRWMRSMRCQHSQEVDHGPPVQRVQSADSGQQVLAWSRDQVEPALRAAVGSMPLATQRITNYHFGWEDEDGTPARADGGKALRPALVLLAAQAVGGTAAAARPGGGRGRAGAQLLPAARRRDGLRHDPAAPRRRRGRSSDSARRSWPVTRCSAWRSTYWSPAATLRPTRPRGCWAQPCRSWSTASWPTRTSRPGTDVVLVRVRPDGAAEDRRAARVLDGARRASRRRPAGAGRPPAAVRRGSRSGLPVRRRPARHLGDPGVTGKPVHSDLRRRKKSLPVVAALTSGTRGRARARPRCTARTRRPVRRRVGPRGRPDRAGGGRAPRARPRPTLCSPRRWAISGRRRPGRPADELERLARLATRRDRLNWGELDDEHAPSCSRRRVRSVPASSGRSRSSSDLLEQRRPADLRPQADRAQHARRGRPGEPWRRLRRRAGRGPGRRDRRVLRPRGRARGPRRGGARRGLDVVDATCPLVTKVHAEARRYAARGDTVVLIGHAGHEEVEGTMGEAPEQTVLVETRRGRRGLGGRRSCAGLLPDPDHAGGRRDDGDPRCLAQQVSRRCGDRTPPTSVTRPPTGRRRWERSPSRPTWCSWSGRRTRPTRCAWSSSPSATGHPAYLIDERPAYGRSGSTASRSSG